MQRQVKNTFRLLAILLLVAAIVYFMRKYSADISSVRNLSWKSIGLIGAWSFASYTTYAYAVYIVLVDLGLKGLRPVGWIKIYYVSRLVNLFIVQGGNLYRLIMLKKNYGFSYTNSIGVTAFLIWINASVALLVSAIMLSTFDELFELNGISLRTWCIVLLFAALTVPLIAILGRRVMRKSSDELHRFARPILDVTEFFVETISRTSFFAKVTALGAVHYILFIGVNYVSFVAIGVPLDLPVVCLYTTAFVFTRYINVVPGNLGVSELIGGLVSEQLGVGFGNGLVVAGVVRIIEVIMIVFAGLIYGKFAVFEYYASRKQAERNSG